MYFTLKLKKLIGKLIGWYESLSFESSFIFSIDLRDNIFQLNKEIKSLIN